MNDEPDITANFHQGNPQSEAAFNSPGAKPRRRAARYRILNYALYAGRTGITSDQACAELGLSHQSGSARFSELRRDLWLIGIGELRATRSGELAEVHVHKTYATAHEIERATTTASRRVNGSGPKKIWIGFFEDCDGCSAPEKAFASEEAAKAWASEDSYRQYDVLDVE